jgi:hypothetical protein
MKQAEGDARQVLRITAQREPTAVAILQTSRQSANCMSDSAIEILRSTF